jgi:hypothetical protein
VSVALCNLLIYGQFQTATHREVRLLLKRSRKPWLAAWAAEPIAIELTADEVMEQLDPGWKRWRPVAALKTQLRLSKERYDLGPSTIELGRETGARV